ncbi:ribosome recycling factor domain-containing protein [Globomyces pollinis-pini]|nr:ribosome recycling factor domain-containing protein [Globomyces pollinis-pini]
MVLLPRYTLFVRLFHSNAFNLAKSSSKKSSKPLKATNIDYDIQPLKLKLDKCIHAFEQSLDKIRIGRANPAILDPVLVNLNQKQIPLTQIAQIHVKDASNLMVVLPDEDLTGLVEKSIKGHSKLGLNPIKIDSTTLKVPIPRMTEESKKALLKSIHVSAEKTRVVIRKHRQDTRKQIKTVSPEATTDTTKLIENLIQIETDGSIKKVDSLSQLKESEINQN